MPAIGCQCEVCRSTEPHDKRLRQSAFLETNGGIRVLIDCGPDFRQQTTRFPFTKLDAVVISHIHFDHVAGIDDLRPYCMFGDVDIYCQEDVVQALLRDADSVVLDGNHQIFLFVPCGEGDFGLFG